MSYVTAVWMELPTNFCWNWKGKNVTFDIDFSKVPQCLFRRNKDQSPYISPHFDRCGYSYLQNDIYNIYKLGWPRRVSSSYIIMVISCIVHIAGRLDILLSGISSWASFSTCDHSFNYYLLFGCILLI